MLAKDAVFPRVPMPQVEEGAAPDVELLLNDQPQHAHVLEIQDVESRTSP